MNITLAAVCWCLQTMSAYDVFIETISVLDMLLISHQLPRVVYYYLTVEDHTKNDYVRLDIYADDTKRLHFASLMLDNNRVLVHAQGVADKVYNDMTSAILDTVRMITSKAHVSDKFIDTTRRVMDTLIASVFANTTPRRYTFMIPGRDIETARMQIKIVR